MIVCAECSAEVSDGALNCPQCLRLTHAQRLEELAKQARAAWRVGRFAEERELWIQSLSLLPPDTVQYAKIQSRIAELDQQAAVASEAHSGGWRKASAGIVPAILLLLSKGKALLLGLTKMGTLLTMLASLGVYWKMYGWAFAAGLVFSIYIHEMGHVIAIRRYGFRATAPMFIPGLGAFIRMRGVKLPPIPDSRIGLAGPVYGVGAAITALILAFVTHAKIWFAIAHFGAVVNLFNLIPVWSLDGSRGLRSLTRLHRGIVLAVAAALWMFGGNPMLFLIAAACTYRMFTRDWQQEPDNQGLIQFVVLLIVLSAIAAFSPLESLPVSTS
jgi:Zn-dependent protease